jgi:hypothetical protein
VNTIYQYAIIKTRGITSVKAAGLRVEVWKTAILKNTNTRNNSNTILSFKSGYRIFLYNSKKQVNLKSKFQRHLFMQTHGFHLQNIYANVSSNKKLLSDLWNDTDF